MPEGPEIELDKLNEAIHDEMEKDGGRFLKQIALTTAVLAAFAAVAALEAGSTVNEALVLKTESTRFQAQASDQWSYYQAKGVKAAVQEASKVAWEAIGKQAPTQYADKAARYTEEQVEIKKKAEELEKSRDERSAEADALLHEHHRFANTVALFQVSIALGALAALTRNRPLWIGSLIIGLSGIALFVLSFLS
jgi:hypothetical protein